MTFDNADSLAACEGRIVKWCGRQVKIMRQLAWIGRIPVGIVPCQVCGRGVPFKMLHPDGRKNRQIPDVCAGRCELVLVEMKHKEAEPCGE